MKKIICVICGAVLFLALLAVSIYIPSRDNFSNISNGYLNKTVEIAEENMVNWSRSEDSYTSLEDPQIVLNGLCCYVHTIKISGDLSGNEFMESLENTDAQIFYTEFADEGFSEEKSISAQMHVAGDGTYYTVDKNVYSLRIDLVNSSGLTIQLTEIEINDRSPIIGLGVISKYCLLPMFVLGGIVLLMTKGHELVPYVNKLKKYIPLLKNLISRDLKVKYRRSFLGFLWSILNPLLMALVLNAVFSRLFRFQIEHFAVYYLTGSLIFNFVIECTSGSLTSILAAAPLIKKVYIPKYIFPLEKCCFAFVNMLFGVVAVIVVMIIQGVEFHLCALLFFVPMIYAFVFAYGMGLVLAALTVFFRDMEHLYSVWTTIWMYLTPIIYPEELLVENGLGLIMKANPMYYYTHSLRSLVMYNTLPTLEENIICVVFALIMLVIGLLFFKKTQDRFILYI